MGWRAPVTFKNPLEENNYPLLNRNYWHKRWSQRNFFLQTRYYMLFLLPVFIQNSFSLFWYNTQLIYQGLERIRCAVTYRFYWIISVGYLNHFAIVQAHLIIELLRPSVSLEVHVKTTWSGGACENHMKCAWTATTVSRGCCLLMGDPSEYFLISCSWLPTGLFAALNILFNIHQCKMQEENTHVDF